ncbi:flavin reductase family protein [Catenisphaera adipataccumulans]|jgi:flavin reductase (DIM6/NTAB) family NADH-FMN oxidoreductase RutF|uniref:Flavin reductase (DIM6/NTAB) family NADH-FMN oxidoreductase RutF n=1 Tax=Catenisphaera adipataccumulans TaxID=700500 RepID=A0A7W8CWS1_9FIRM|nr:flavin reductase family protein [Catenisphaera adipataccumulans]MBB5182761.1 flavin reductase (DIM6/NTAB) family NADH-FMN oxidoreductase RutF [Catenisphaera adipataccumulans]
MRKDFGGKPFMYPQPVLIIGTYNEDGTANAMNAAWGGICGADRIIIDLSMHKTTENILREKAFTVHMADVKHETEADYLGLVSGNKVPDKLTKAGFHTTASAHVHAPIIEELPLALECELVHQTEEGIVGKIVNVSIDESVLDENGKLDPDRLEAIAFDPMNAAYLRVGGKVGNAFSDGKKLM